jgi:hypothetical protein
MVMDTLKLVRLRAQDRAVYEVLEDLEDDATIVPERYSDLE